MLRPLAALTVVGLIGLVNLRAHRPGDLETTVAQLRFLQSALDDHAAEGMQEIFPEGYVFTWALYGLASAQVAGRLDGADARRSQQLEQARRALEQVRSARARSTFDVDLDPPHGAFYSAWSLYLLAEYVRATGPGRAPARLLGSFEEECARFAAALDRSPTPFLPSYPHASWPVDTAVGIAALGIHDAMLPPRYGDAIGRWVTRASQRLDARLGVVSHAADAETGAPSGARGSSLALMSRVLVDAAPQLAFEQYSVLRSHFVDYRWGVPGVREHPRGAAGPADVDSGPIVFGYSGPAVVVGAAAARAHGDESLARVLFGVVEVAGLPVQLAGRRRYAGGFLPVGDAFIAWARSARLASGAAEERWEPVLPAWWSAPAHVVSALLAVLVLRWGLLPHEARCRR